MSKLEGSGIQTDGDGLHDELFLSPLSRHVRERTQIIDDDSEEPEELYVYKPMRLDSKTSSSEYSKPATYLPRPLPKSSAETSSDKESETAKPPPVPVRSALRTAPSSTDTGSGPGKPDINGEMASKYTPFNATPRSTPTHIRSLNALQGNQPRERRYPASKLPRKQARPAEHAGPMSSPGIAAAVDQQFGAVNDSTSAKPAANVTH